ncbi:DegV family protein [Cellulosilyticum sp. I15G10I2]|uniref:DegV family protein n=1 Tax=Cellulosilyticum sp. I15G10I2 TaxID=1892843 RepID=UPI00085C518B|nr:DegV family protein [Cellulosilyticum sp. I15G10I2]
MIKLVTDSTSYIPQEYIEKYDISIISLSVILNGKSTRELEIDTESFYNEMQNAQEMPTSSQPAPEEVFKTFERIIQNGDSALGIFLSSDMSGTFSGAHITRDLLLEKYPHAQIELLDSRTNCMQMGYAVIEAAHAASLYKSMDDIIKSAMHVITHSTFLFIPDTLTYLKKGGRIGTAASLLGNLLQIKPILTVQNGMTTIFTKVRTKKKAIDTMVDKFLQDINGADLGGVIVHHINCPEEGALLANNIKEKVHIDVTIQCIGPVIGLHVGPGCVGIAYYTK